MVVMSEIGRTLLGGARQSQNQISSRVLVLWGREWGTYHRQELERSSSEDDDDLGYESCGTAKARPRREIMYGRAK